MNGYLTDSRLARIINLPIALPQTELRAGKTLVVGTVNLQRGQRLELRSLSLNVAYLLTVGALPDYAYSAYGIALVSLFYGKSDCTPLAHVYSGSRNVYATDAYRRCVFTSPGEYRILVRNNTNNLDLSVAASGAMKIYV